MGRSYSLRVSIWLVDVLWNWLTWEPQVSRFTHTLDSQRSRLTYPVALISFIGYLLQGRKYVFIELNLKANGLLSELQSEVKSQRRLWKLCLLGLPKLSSLISKSFEGSTESSQAVHQVSFGSQLGSETRASHPSAFITTPYWLFKSSFKARLLWKTTEDSTEGFTYNV